MAASRAGIQAAPAPTASRTSATAANMPIFHGSTPSGRMSVRGRIAATASGRPTTNSTGEYRHAVTDGRPENHGASRADGRADRHFARAAARGVGNRTVQSGKDEQQPMPASDPAKIAAMRIGNRAPAAASVSGRTSTAAPESTLARALSQRLDPLRAVAGGGNQQLREGKRGKEHRRVVLAQGAKLGIGGHADHLEDARLFAAGGDFGADGIVVAEQAAGQGLVENDRHGVGGCDRRSRNRGRAGWGCPGRGRTARRHPVRRHRERPKAGRRGGARSPAIAVRPSAAACRSK